jgi:hypothetical protein
VNARANMRRRPRVIGIFVIVMGAGCRLLPEDDGRAALALANLRDGGKPLTGVPKDKRFKQRRKEAPTEGPARGIRLDALRRGASMVNSTERPKPQRAPAKVVAEVAVEAVCLG